MKRIFTLTLLALLAIGGAKATDYVVAGSNATAFGAEWSNSNASAKMTKNSASGYYVYVSNSFTVTAKTTIQFKVTKYKSSGGDWEDSHPDNNYEVYLENAGTYKLYVFFDGSSTVGAATSWTVAGEPAAVFNGSKWATDADANEMTYNEETGMFEWTSPQFTYSDAVSFKAVANHSWNSEAYPSSNMDVSVGTKGNSYHLKVIYDPIKKNTSYNLYITATMSSNFPYATLYYGSDNLEVPTGVAAYAAHYSSGNQIDFTATWSAGEVIPKGTPVVIHGEEAGKEYAFNVKESATSKSGTNDLIGTDEAKTIEAEDGYYMYGLNYVTASDGTKTVGFYWQKGTGGSKVDMKAHRACLTLKQDAITSTRSAIFFGNGESGEGETTGVSQVTGHGSQVTNIFDLQGRKLSKVQRGVNIVGGKKVLVR